MLDIEDILKKYGAEQALLVLICRVFVATATRSELDSFLAAHEINWGELHKAVYRNKIRPVVAHVLLPANIPDDFRKQLRNSSIALVMQSTEHRKELIRLSGILQAGGIDAIPYKGIPLSSKYYGNYTLREFTDIDFLVEFKDASGLQKLCELFIAQGYVPMYAIPKDFANTLFENSCEIYFDKHENGKRKFHVEFHWLAHHPVFDLPGTLSNATLFDKPETFDESFNEVKVLNTENHFATVVLHHGVKENWNSLKYILDLAQMIKTTDINWQQVLKVSDKYKFTKVQTNGLWLVCDLLGVKAGILAEQDKQDNTPYLDVMLSQRKKRRSLFQKQLRKIRNVDDNMGRFRIISKSVVYSFQPSIIDYNFLPLPKNLYFLYFFVKLGRITAGAFQKKAVDNNR